MRYKQTDTLREKALAALKDAAVRVREEHRLAGLPLIVWKDGKVVREYVKDSASVRERPARYSRE